TPRGVPAAVRRHLRDGGLAPPAPPPGTRLPPPHPGRSGLVRGALHLTSSGHLVPADVRPRRPPRPASAAATCSPLPEPAHPHRAAGPAGPALPLDDQARARPADGPALDVRLGPPLTVVRYDESAARPPPRRSPHLQLQPAVLPAHRNDGARAGEHRDAVQG